MIEMQADECTAGGQQEMEKEDVQTFETEVRIQEVIDVGYQVWGITKNRQGRIIGRDFPSN